MQDTEVLACLLSVLHASTESFPLKQSNLLLSGPQVKGCTSVTSQYFTTTRSYNQPDQAYQTILLSINRDSRPENRLMNFFTSKIFKEESRLFWHFLDQPISVRRPSQKSRHRLKSIGATTIKF